LGEGGSIVWYRIVSYRYTMLILSIVSNRLCLVSPTSTDGIQNEGMILGTSFLNGGVAITEPVKVRTGGPCFKMIRECSSESVELV